MTLVQGVGGWLEAGGGRPAAMTYVGPGFSPASGQ